MLCTGYVFLQRVIFVSFVENNATMSSIRYFENHIFCAKAKEVDPIKLISLGQISVSIALKNVINNNVLNRIRSSVISTPFFIENIYNRYIFYGGVVG